jgi:hypothetical protein
MINAVLLRCAWLLNLFCGISFLQKVRILLKS